VGKSDGRNLNEEREVDVAVRTGKALEIYIKRLI
jgi:hypothetical protein